MRSTAIIAAILAFFGVAILSFFAGCGADTCCLRAIGGAVVMYAVVLWAARTVRNVLVDAIMNQQTRRNNNANNT
jgi:ABC-type transport system involved in cytochrome c biogenesis permease component